MNLSIASASVDFGRISPVTPSKAGLPPETFHAAGPSPGGWTIMAVHDSKANWEEFRDNVLMPRLKQGIPGGFNGPPQETSFDVGKMFD